MDPHHCLKRNRILNWGFLQTEDEFPPPPPLRSADSSLNDSQLNDSNSTTQSNVTSECSEAECDREPLVKDSRGRYTRLPFWCPTLILCSITQSTLLQSLLLWKMPNSNPLQSKEASNTQATTSQWLKFKGQWRQKAPSVVSEKDLYKIRKKKQKIPVFCWNTRSASGPVRCFFFFKCLLSAIWCHLSNY